MEGITGKQMCEKIAEYLLAVEGITVVPECIWNMSPSGELWPVFSLYKMALRWKEPNILG